jgi:UPF0755 protein
MRSTTPPLWKTLARRALAVVALALFVGAAAAFAVVVAGRGGGGSVAPQATFRVLFPEGFTRRQMATRVGSVAAKAARDLGRPFALTAQSYLAASARARVPCFAATVRSSLEGFLFPATYDIAPTTTATQLVASQLQAFCREWGGVDLSQARSRHLTPYDVLEIASMIEREAVVPEERALVAAVAYNRLRAGMPLGFDSTIRYGLHVPARREILASELADPTPYNTRVHTGLPPTPIANPGLAAIRAAAHPASVDYLYFVRRPDKRHHFFTASAHAFYVYECAHGYGC